MVAHIEDRQCVRAQARLVKDFISKGCPFPAEKRKSRISEEDASAEPSHLNEKWRRVTGMRPSHWLSKHRATRLSRRTARW